MGFKGGTPELKVFYFDAMTTGQAEGFNKTKKSILEYIGRRNYTGPLVEQSLDAGRLILDDLPDSPDASAVTPEPILRDIFNGRIKLLQVYEIPTWMIGNK